MKLRNGFVSNSSSASFHIKIKDLSDDQLTLFKNALEDKTENVGDIIDLIGHLNINYDRWSVMIFDGTIIGDTFCNNGEIEGFFNKLNIPKDKIDFWDQNDEGFFDEDFFDED